MGDGTMKPARTTAGDELAYAAEWGGAIWIDLLRQGLEAIGDLSALRVLEVGARSGRLAAYVARRGATVVAIDITPGFEADVVHEAELQGVGDRVEARLDDGRLGSVVKETFDLVMTKSALVVIPDRDTYLATIEGLMTPGGAVLFIENGKGGRVADALRRLRRPGWDHRRISYFDRAAIDALGRRFTLVRVVERRLPPVWLFVGRRRSRAGDPARDRDAP